MAATIEDLPGELWKPVVGYEGLYEVSNLGRVRSLDRVVFRGDTPVHRIGRLMSCAAPDSNGYRNVRISRGGRGRTVRVCRLVAESFIGPCPKGMECCHFNGIPTDDRAANLRWDTHHANVLDRVRHGRVTGPKGSASQHAKLTEADIPAIRARIERGESDATIAADYGVSGACIWTIRRGRSWKHVS